MSTVVLVHPAWFGGWCWRKLTPLLGLAAIGCLPRRSPVWVNGRTSRTAVSTSTRT